MAAEVASSLLSSGDVDLYGNIIQNGYLSVVPNTTNKKAWQYAETTTAPVDLPSLTETRPAYRGWTTNYQEYFTHPQPPTYTRMKPGMPTMFRYGIQNRFPLLAPMKQLVLREEVGGPNVYTPGTYTGLALQGGFGVNGTVDITVNADGYINYWAVNNPGSLYAFKSQIYVSAGDLGGTADAYFWVTEIDVAQGTAGMTRYLKPPVRYNQQAVDNISTPQYINNPAVIQYSFLHPVLEESTGFYQFTPNPVTGTTTQANVPPISYVAV